MAKMRANRKKTFWVINDFRVLNVKQVIRENPFSKIEEKVQSLDLMHWNAEGGFWEWLGEFFLPMGLNTDLDRLQYTLSNNGEERMM